MRGLCQRFAQLLSRSTLAAVQGPRLCQANAAPRLFSSLVATANNANLVTIGVKNVGITNTLNFSRSIHLLQIGQNAPGILSNALSRCDTSHQPSRNATSLLQMYKRGRPYKTKRKKMNILSNKPQMKGVVLRTVVKKPKKPNSANRKCVLVRLTNGLEKVVYVPGEGHNLQEHNVVLVQHGRLRDVPGVKGKCIRGAYDLPHVQKSKV